VNLAVDIARHLELLGRLRRCLAQVGVRAEVREHLMSLVVFPPAPALPVCVFVSGDGQFYSWDCGQKRQAVADVTQAADNLAATVGGVISARNGSASEGAGL
jgi:hypothetical protein